VSPFVNLDERALRELSPNGTVRPYPKHAVLITEGDVSDSLYVILSGRVKVFVTDDQGKEVVLATIAGGDYFGELVLDGGPRSASIMALEPCRFYVIPHDDVERMLAASPEFARDLIHKLIGKVRSLTSRVSDLVMKDVYARLAGFLEENAVEGDGGRVLAERLTQSDIAARIGGSREMVSRILRDLAAGGYISVDSKQITLKRKLPPHW